MYFFCKFRQYLSRIFPYNFCQVQKHLWQRKKKKTSSENWKEEEKKKRKEGKTHLIFSGHWSMMVWAPTVSLLQEINKDAIFQTLTPDHLGQMCQYFRVNLMLCIILSILLPVSVALGKAGQHGVDTEEPMNQEGCLDSRLLSGKDTARQTWDNGLGLHHLFAAWLYARRSTCWASIFISLKQGKHNSPSKPHRVVVNIKWIDHRERHCKRWGVI